MPRKYLMTWEQGPTRWRKMYRGKVWTVSCRDLGTPPTKEDSWQSANTWWRGKVLTIGPAPGRPAVTLDPLSALLHRLLSAVPLDRLAVMMEKGGAAELLTNVMDMKATTEAAGGKLRVSAETVSELSDLADIVTGKPADPVKGLRHHAENWKSLSQASNNRRLTLSRHLDFFLNFMGDCSLDTVTEQTWEGFYLHLKNSDRCKSLDAGYKAHIQSTVKRFIGYLYRNRLIAQELRNLKGPELAFRIPVHAVVPVSVETVRAFYAAAQGQTRLHVLLGLNCGMLAKDMSDLNDEEVDWKAGTITRKRSKTADHEDVPTVTYKLWPTTWALLQEYRSGGPIVLLRPSGERWVKESEGKYRSDALGKRFRTDSKKAGVSLSPAQLRTVAADMLGQHPQFKFYTETYLGHSPRTVTEKHYQRPSEAEFFAAIAWLESQFSLT